MLKRRRDVALPLLESGNEPVAQDFEGLQRENLFLRQDNANLREQVKEIRDEADREHKATLRGVGELRRQLSPLYRALQAVFGELDVFADEGPTPAASPKVSAVWESWKQKLPGKKAEVIQALLDHGEMTIPQLRVATHSGQQTVYDVTSALFRLGLLNKNGGKYSLKQL
jgi:hypothetical protein